jgi:hypothetical protein
MIQRIRQGVARAGRAAVCYGGGTLQFIQELKEELRADRTLNGDQQQHRRFGSS